MPDGFNALKKRILGEYEQAYKEISAKAQDFADKSKVRELEMREKLKDGKITQAQFDSWMKGQVFQGAQWEDRKKQMAATLRHADEVTAQMANGERFRQFAYGHNRIVYEITKDAGVMINFTQYDADTVRRLIKDRPDLLPPRKLAGKNKAYRYYNRMMDRIATQGILQGENVQKIANRIAKETGESAAGAALRHARTMQTSAQNAGRLEGMHRAQDMGIKLKKMWIATLDGRTRDSHRDLDGQTQDIDKPFDSPLGDIMFPGDPDAAPGNVWNCRCTLGNSYPEYPYDILKRRDNETKQIVENMTYRQWEKATGRAKPEEENQQGVAEKYQEYTETHFDKEYAQVVDAWKKLQKDTDDAYKRAKSLYTPGRKSEEFQKALDEYNRLRAEYAKTRDEFGRKYGIEQAAASAKKLRIAYNPLKKATAPFDEEKVISRLGGGDLTKGSCASLGFCWVGQKAGYDVLDFRDGESRSLFATDCANILKSLKTTGLNVIEGTAKSYLTAGKNALKQAEEGKEYYLECGRHAAIVRKMGGIFQYLELQSAHNNGWQSFRENQMDAVLTRRFGASRKGVTFGDKAYSYMASVDDMAKSDRFLNILGFINTDESAQKKGVMGRVR